MPNLPLADELFTLLRELKRPALLEAGREPFDLMWDSYTLTERAGTLSLHAWNDERSVAHTVKSFVRVGPGRLKLECLSLFGKPRTLEVVDRDNGLQRHRQLTAVRTVYMEQLRRSLARRFPGWGIQELSTGANLQHSLSPAYPRALVRRGNTAWAAMLATPMSDVDAVLSFGLIWHHHCRKQEKRAVVEGLAIFVPIDQHQTTALRLRYLDRSRFDTALYNYDADGMEEQMDLLDDGNLRRALESPWSEPKLRAYPGPERRLEDQLRQRIELVNANLTAPVYGQVPAFAANDRDLIDLLAAERGGRLAVLELKASEDIQLPLQALDYWMRVDWHVRRDEFTSRGYFPGRALRKESPRLYFVAPALDFHPSNATVLRYFSPVVDWEMVGVTHPRSGALSVAFRRGSRSDDELVGASEAGGNEPESGIGAGVGGASVPHWFVRGK
ncbi:MAG: hypothetical protein K2X03_23650 [Bryobacteraceae bacterium]|nr:hypothetical protein [Bryobacteraceae bacterium]